MRRDEIMKETFKSIIVYISSSEKLDENGINFNVLKLYSEIDWQHLKMP